MDTQELTGFRVHVGLAATIELVGRYVVGEVTAGVNLVAGTQHHALGFTADDVRCVVDDGFILDDTASTQEGVDRLQRDGRNGFSNRLHARLRRQLDGAAVTAVDHQTRLTVDVDQGDHITGIDKMGVGYLRVGVPDFRPLPGQTKKAP